MKFAARNKPGDVLSHRTEAISLYAETAGEELFLTELERLIKDQKVATIDVISTDGFKSRLTIDRDEDM